MNQFLGVSEVHHGIVVQKPRTQKNQETLQIMPISGGAKES